MKRLRLLWQLAGQLQEIKTYPNGKIEIIFKKPVDLQVNDIMFGPNNYEK